MFADIFYLDINEKQKLYIRLNQNEKSMFTSKYSIVVCVVRIVTCKV